MMLLRYETLFFNFRTFEGEIILQFAHEKYAF